MNTSAYRRGRRDGGSVKMDVVRGVVCFLLSIAAGIGCATTPNATSGDEPERGERDSTDEGDSGGASSDEGEGETEAASESIASLQVTGHRVLARTADGKRYGWGKIWSEKRFASTHAPVRQRELERFTDVDGTCGFDERGRLWCWGANRWGLLGAGLDTRLRSGRLGTWTMVQVDGGDRFVDVSHGGRYVCALDGSGKPWCWGGVRRLQIPVEKRGPLETPKKVESEPSFVEIVTARTFACVRDESGRAYCWGKLPERGGDDSEDRNYRKVASPEMVSMGLRFERLLGAESNVVCGIPVDRDGYYCWGRADLIDPANGKVQAFEEPTALDLGFDASSVAFGDEVACAVDSNGQVHCWGYDRPRGASNRGGGLLGVGEVARDEDSAGRRLHEPQPLALDGTFQSVDVGDAAACALSDSGRVACWGWDRWGAVGDGPPESRPLPELDVSIEHTGGAGLVEFEGECGLDTGRRAWCWGRSSVQRSRGGSRGPSRVEGNRRFRAIDAGRYRNFGLTLEGELVGWGDNSDGELADGTTKDRLRPTPVAADGPFVDFGRIGGDYCGLRTDGTLLCWNYFVRDSGAQTPSPKAPETSFRSISQGCALSREGDIHCWGPLRRRAHVFGRSRRYERKVIAAEEPFRTFDLSRETEYGCGLTPSGKAYCWGTNRNGLLGRGLGEGSDEPVEVKTDRRFEKIYTFDTHACGLQADGTAHCWGGNWSGELGNGENRTYAATPVRVEAEHAFEALWTVEVHVARPLTRQGWLTCGRTESRELYCWGLDRLTPQRVASNHSILAFDDRENDRVLEFLTGDGAIVKSVPTAQFEDRMRSEIVATPVWVSIPTSDDGSP